MASADAIWRTFLQLSAACEDKMSLMHDIGVLRPRETGIYGSKPRFRRMHQLVTYDGICWHLNCWRVEVRKQNHNSLEAFALSEPSFNNLQTIANRLARDYIANHQLRRMRKKKQAQCDQQFKNGLLLNRYMLLYEELSWVMNHGDIGHLKTCIIAWILLFKVMGKHKYTAHMTEFLCNVHFTSLPGLRKAVWYHILVNPTGQKGKFQGVDWCVELNNLLTKVINGGKGSNHTVDRIILESPLVQVYRNLHSTFTRNFMHAHLTSRHAEADMAKMFCNVSTYMDEHSPHVQGGGDNR
ncbi:hypothetical protein PAXRUDRAFT_779574, partial [Paxillus rubicundulus Ve08.2h10]